MIKKIFVSLFMLAVILVAGGLAFVWQIGAWNILFPSSSHDATAPALPAELDSAVLVFTKTNGFRHKDGILGGLRAFDELSKRHGFAVFATENGAIFNPDDLKRFDVVVFLNATGDMLSENQETAFKEWLQAGGGWLGIL